MSSRELSSFGLLQDGIVRHSSIVSFEAFSLHPVSEPDHCAETVKNGIFCSQGGLDDLQVCPQAELWGSGLRYFLLTHGKDGGRPLRPELLIQQPDWLGD